MIETLSTEQWLVEIFYVSHFFGTTHVIFPMRILFIIKDCTWAIRSFLM